MRCHGNLARILVRREIESMRPNSRVLGSRLMGLLAE
jgi:hypothetical protein